MKLHWLAAALFPMSVLAQAQTQKETADLPATASYSQEVLLKNWAFSVCLAKVAKTQDAKDDANAAASAYLEFGKLPIASYEPLRALADRYAKRVYGGATPGEFNTMKCIDLMHSEELEALASKLARAGVTRGS